MLPGGQEPPQPRGLIDIQQEIEEQFESEQESNGEQSAEDSRSERSDDSQDEERSENSYSDQQKSDGEAPYGSDNSDHARRICLTGETECNSEVYQTL
jgi:hypothetical protein